MLNSFNYYVNFLDRRLPLGDFKDPLCAKSGQRPTLTRELPKRPQVLATGLLSQRHGTVSLYSGKRRSAGSEREHLPVCLASGATLEDVCRGRSYLDLERVCSQSQTTAAAAVGAVVGNGMKSRREDACA
jgi:hypothetical protein